MNTFTSLLALETHHLIIGLLVTALWCYLTYMAVKHVFAILGDIEDYLLSHSQLSIWLWLMEAALSAVFGLLLVVMYIIALFKAG